MKLCDFMKINELFEKQAKNSVKSIFGGRKNEIYDLLMKSIGYGPFDGGCVLFARALQIRYGGNIFVIVGTSSKDSKKIQAQHAFLRIGNYCVDADGVENYLKYPESFAEKELDPIGGKVYSIRPIKSSDLPNAPRNEELSQKIAKLLPKKLPT